MSDKKQFKFDRVGKVIVWIENDELKADLKPCDELAEYLAGDKTPKSEEPDKKKDRSKTIANFKSFFTGTGGAFASDYEENEEDET